MGLPERLRPSVRRLLQDPESERWLSPVSVWEAALLHRKRRIALPRGVEAIVAELNASAAIRFAPLTAEIAIAVSRLELSTNDPADNFIAATAAVNGLTLVTADACLLRVPGLKTMRA